MADFDSAAKRFSGLCLGDSLPVLPIPDGTIASGDRQHFLDLYSGIAADAPPAVTLDTRGSAMADSAFASSAFLWSAMSWSAFRPPR